jgi:flagellin
MANTTLNQKGQTMSNVTLTAGVRSNLLSLQTLSSELNTAQEQLATGKSVNSAFDNPAAYFTAQSLTNRANELSTLLDNIGQAQQTLQAANQGLTSITSLLQSAISVAKQAQQSPQVGANFGALNISGQIAQGYTETIGADTASSTFSPVGTAAGTLAIIVNTNGATNTYSVSIGANDSVSQVVNDVNNTVGLGSLGAVSATDVGGTLALVANDSNVNFTVVDGATAEALNLTTAGSNTTENSTSFFSLLQAQGGVSGDSLTVAVNGAAPEQIQFGTGVNQIQTLKQLNEVLAALPGGATAGASGSAVTFSLAANTTQQNTVTLGGSSDVLTALGLTSGTQVGSQQLTNGQTSTTRSTLQANYNALLAQIDQLAGDSSYNGVNLLNGDNLKVTFNETDTSSLTINGVTDTSAGLGLGQVYGTGFQLDSNINNVLTELNNALSTVQAQTETFGSNLTTIQTRQSFTQNLINTLQTGSDDLTLADQNEVSANLLTLQTRQQLAISALSISNQANQAILKLFP